MYESDRKIYTPSGKARAFPWHYRMFGLAVASEVEFPGLPLVQCVDRADVVIEVGFVPDMAHDGYGHVGANAEGVLRAIVEGGQRIVVAPNPEADASYVAAVVSGELFAILLRQRGLLVLHGSAVARDGRGVGFIGDSGWGKSTLAASLVERGWRLLTDDLLVIAGLEEGTPAIVSGHSSMRLAPDAARHLGDGSEDTLPRAHGLTRKLRVERAEAFLDARVHLDRLYVLGTGRHEIHRAVPLPSLQAVLQMAYHTRGQRLLTGEGVRSQHLEQCAALAERVAVFHLFRRDGLEHMAGLCDIVEAAGA